MHKSWWMLLFFLFTLAVAGKHPCYAGIQDGPDGVDTLSATPNVCLTNLAHYPSGNPLRDLDAIRAYNECINRAAAPLACVDERQCTSGAEINCEGHGGVCTLDFFPAAFDWVTGYSGRCNWKCCDGTKSKYTCTHNTSVVWV